MKRLMIILSMVTFLYAGDTIIYVGEFKAQGPMRDVWVVGDTGYLVGWIRDTSKIIFLDLTDRTNPQEINYFPMGKHMQCIEVHDSLAYFTKGGTNPNAKRGLWIVNIKDPLNPAVVGSLLIPDAITDLEVIDTLCYTCGESTLYIINIKDPQSPYLVSQLSLPALGILKYLKFHNSVIYTADETGAKLYSVDVSDPNNPVFLDEIMAPPLPYPWTPSIFGIDIYSNYAYCGVDSGIWIVDISDPSNLQRANVIPYSYNDNVWIRDTLLFFTGPSVWRLTPDPVNPELLAHGPYFVGYDIFADSSYYIYYIVDNFQDSTLRIYQFKEVGVKEKGSKGNKEYLDFKNLKDKIKILYSIPSKSGFIYITDESGRILEILKKNISGKGSFLWKPKRKGIYFLILETKNKKITKKLNILK